MQSQANISGRIRLGAAIGALTVSYALAIAALALYTYDAGWKVAGLLFDEVLFSGPMLLAYGLSRMRTSDAASRTLLGFGVGYSILTVIIVVATFSGEPEAQYQLRLFLIPLIGLPPVVVAGLIAARLR